MSATSNYNKRNNNSCNTITNTRKEEEEVETQFNTQLRPVEKKFIILKSPPTAILKKNKISKIIKRSKAILIPNSNNSRLNVSLNNSINNNNNSMDKYFSSLENSPCSSNGIPSLSSSPSCRKTIITISSPSPKSSKILLSTSLERIF
ncbi:hypothetical protein ABK040_014887 [Willaertia magna]